MGCQVSQGVPRRPGSWTCTTGGHSRPRRRRTPVVPYPSSGNRSPFPPTTRTLSSRRVLGNVIDLQNGTRPRRIFSLPLGKGEGRGRMRRKGLSRVHPLSRSRVPRLQWMIRNSVVPVLPVSLRTENRVWRRRVMEFCHSCHSEVGLWFLFDSLGPQWSMILPLIISLSKLPTLFGNTTETTLSYVGFISSINL